MNIGAAQGRGRRSQPAHKSCLRHRIGSWSHLHWYLLCVSGLVLGSLHGVPQLHATAPSGVAQTKPGQPSRHNPEVKSRRVVRYRPNSLATLLGTCEIGTFSWSPDGRRLIGLTSLSGHPNLWSIDVRGMGWPQQLTFGLSQVAEHAISPDGAWVIFRSRLEPAPGWDLYALSLEDGRKFRLTNTPTVSERDVSWDFRGQRIAYVAEDLKTGMATLMVREFDVRSSAEAPIERAPSPYTSERPLWHPKADEILIHRVRSIDDIRLSLVNGTTGEERVLTPGEGKQIWHAEGWSTNGDRILATANVDGHSNVYLIDAATRTVTQVTEHRGETIAQDWSPDGKRISWTKNYYGANKVYIAAPIAAPRSTLLRVPNGEIDMVRFSPDSKFLAFRYAGPTRTRDLWIYDLERKTLHQVTFAQDPYLRPEVLVEPIQMTYLGFDGTLLHGFLYVPHNLKAAQQAPTIVWVHDGPSQQQTNGFDPEIQALVSEGYLIFAPNYRGSTGFGMDFEETNDLDWGGGDVQDLVAAARFLRSVPFADPNRVALLGRGYGGYLTMMAITRSPETFNAAVAISAPLDLARIYHRSRGRARHFLEAEMGKPEERQGLWLDRSPAQFLENIRVPVLMMHDGASALVTETDVVKAGVQLNALGKDVSVWIPVANPEVAHPPRNHLLKMQRIQDFLAQNLTQRLPSSTEAEEDEDLETTAGSTDTD